MTEARGAREGHAPLASEPCGCPLLQSYFRCTSVSGQRIFGATEDFVLRFRSSWPRRRYLPVEAIMVTTNPRQGPHRPGRPPRTAKSRIGLIVALSLAAGLIVAVVLVAAPFTPATENVLTGVMLLAFALGWALLAVLSLRFTDQPQRWAVAPAAFMAVAGLVSLSGFAAAQAVFDWVWPPVLFGLV